MTASTLRVRRATVEDLDKLRPLWTSMHLPVAELEPRLTEFQVVEDVEGKVVGAIGFQIGTNHGRLHSEGYSDCGVADSARALLWARIQTLATNHGILRLWTREKTQFWDQLGFKIADEQQLKKLPVNWQAEGAPWLTLQLKDEVAINAAEQEMLMFMGAQKERTDRMMQQVRTLKTLATVIAVILAMCAFGALLYLFLKRPEFLHPVSR
jgi:N-acetylglutamate synthase-like GNAT family acetyltransferase